MGNTSAKAEVSRVVESINNVAKSTVQDCVVMSDQTQDVTIVNTGNTYGGSYRVKQSTDVDSRCFSDTNRQVDLQNRIIDTIAQATDAKSQALLPAFGATRSEAITRLRSMVTNNVTMSNIQRNYNIIKQRQKVTFVNEGTMAGVTVDISQGADVFASSVLQEVDRAGILNTIEAHIDQKASAANESPFAFLGDYAVLIIVLIALAIVAPIMIYLIVRLVRSRGVTGGVELLDAVM